MRRAGIHGVRRGFTLVETLVGTTLLALVLMLSAQVITPSLRIWKLDQARATVEGTALILEKRLAAELVASTAESLTTLADPPSLAFLQADGYDPDSGKPVWNRYVLYSLDTTNRVLHREEWPNPGLSLQVPLLLRTLPTTEPKALTPAELRLAVTSHNGTERPAGHYVSGLQVVRGTREEPVEVVLTFSVPTPHGLESRERRLAMALRN